MAENCFPGKRKEAAKALHVLIVTQYFWPENFRINDLVQGLVEEGHEVTVLTGIPNYPEGKVYPGYGLFRNRRQDYEGAKVVRVPLWPRGRGRGGALALNYLTFAVLASILGPLFCRARYDLVFVHEPSPVTVGIPALVFKKLRRIPVLFWVQDLWPESLSAAGAVRSRMVLKWVGRLVRFIYSGSDRILVASKAFVPSVRSMGGDADKILYFPQSAESFYRPVEVPDEAPEREGLPEGFRIVFAGNIGAAQDFGTILDAAEALKVHPDMHWLIFGDGRMRQWVADQIELRGLSRNVHLLGKRPPEEMPRYFALADVLLMTLKKEPIFALTVPGKVQSYLACGRPVAAAIDGEGARVIVESGAGLAGAAEDAGALADNLLHLYRLPEERRREMGRQGRTYFEKNFEREELLQRLQGWMAEVLPDGEAQAGRTGS